MREDENRMILKAADLASAQSAYRVCAEEFLDPAKQQANVVGMGVGVKWKNSEPTGEPALIVLVSHKVAKEELSSYDLVPQTLADMQTDVLAIGYPIAGGGMPLEAYAQNLVKRVRPVKGGCSIGHPNISAGTIATCVYDILPDSNSCKTSKYYILSNNHVLANSNDAKVGDPIIQPGRADGGSNPRDRVATLNRFIPITFEPPVPRNRHDNLVDAALAEGTFEGLNREVYWIGYVNGWMPKKNVAVGKRVQKTGRTTNYTTGRITATNATVDVNFGAGRTARFKDQIITTCMSAGGDSGSLVSSMDNIAVGLLFAGSPTATIINQIENVRSLLQVEIGFSVK